MKRNIIITICSLCLSCIAFGQEQKTYKELTNEAFQLHSEKNYLSAGKKYSEAFQLADGKGLAADCFNAACAWSLANEPDSAFANLYKIRNAKRFTHIDWLLNDDDLATLHKDTRWKEIIDIINENIANAKTDPLIVLLDSIFYEDQNYRIQLDSVANQYGSKSQEFRNHWRLIHEKDSLNRIQVSKILDEKGWLSSDEVGQKGSMTLFLVIQHADLKTQEKYLPSLREAVIKGNAEAANLAIMEDRVALRQGKRQIYGSQVSQNAKTGEMYVLPLDDPDNVDKRRASVGLQPLGEYLALWNLKWNPEEYKKELPELEKRKIFH